MGSAFAVEVRDGTKTKPTHGAALVRAYAPCLAPNDQTLDGLPACSPPVSSPCSFSTASVLVTAISGEPTVVVAARASKLSGPGTCRTGVYALQLLVRATSDDPTCLDQTCTFADFTVSHPLGAAGSKSPKIKFALEDVLPAEFADSNLEIVAVTLVDPDGTPLATTGLGTASKATRGKSNLTFANARCDTPNTTGALGAACSPPVHTAACDFGRGLVGWFNVKDVGVTWLVRLQDLVGPTECREGIYHVRSTARVTGRRCGDGSVSCTLVDRTLAIPVQAHRGKVDVKELITPGLGLPIDNVELREIGLVEPGGAALGAAGVGYARRLKKPHVAISRHELGDPTDDTFKLDAVFPRAKVDPTTGSGVTVMLSDSDGVGYAATLPAAVWQTKGPRRWVYKDDTGSIGGIRRAAISGSAAKGHGSVKVSFKGRGVDLDAVDRPSQTLQVSIAESNAPGVLTAARNRACRVKPKTVVCR